MTPAERFRRLERARRSFELARMQPKLRRKYTDEDAAFAVAQWCSGIKQNEIAGHFGYSNPTMICNWIEKFIKKYYVGVPLITRHGRELIVGYNGDRKALARIAFCYFMAQREEHAA